MSGGVAYVNNADGHFAERCNMGMVELSELSQSDKDYVKSMVQEHLEATGSELAKGVLADFENAVSKFVKVMPTDYKKILDCFEKVREEGKVQGEDAIALAAFEMAVG
jgi:glutamate synthase domain-containing protein 3